LNIIIIGATSSISYETAKLFASAGANLFLVARSSDHLEIIAADLRARGAGRVETYQLDVNEFEKHEMIFDAAINAFGTLDLLFIAHGTLSDQRACENDPSKTMQEFHTNLLSTVSLFTIAANIIEQQRKGMIAVISSVAGDRGRGSNYVYGAAKAGLSTFTSGLRNRLRKSGVHVLTIKPGQVDTPMTVSYKKTLTWTRPEVVAKDIITAMKKRDDVLYTPHYWRWIMLVIRTIPEPVFKRLKL
jgi:short-subunit dehydrogenase